MLQVIYGGTFDPVHNGHLAIAKAARDALQADVRLVPAADPPHRPPPGADARQRAQMLELAVGQTRGLRVDRRELQRPGPSYTVDTLRELRRELGREVPLALLLGADSFGSLDRWHEWLALFDLAHLVIAQRAGNAMETGLSPALAAAVRDRWAADAAQLRVSPAGRLWRLQQPLQAESASDVRERIARERPWEHLVAPPVAGFIRVNRLYGARSL